MNKIINKKEKVFVVPVFIPHSGCPHTCIFCNQNTITGHPARLPSTRELHEIIESFLKYHQNGPVQISFYGGTFLGLPEHEIVRMLTVASEYTAKGLADSIRFSTRPDSISETTLGLLRHFPVKTIELGVQSLSDDVLKKAGRGHTAEDTRQAVGHIKAAGYETGIQLMTGLPGDDESGAVETARQTAALAPDFVRIYPTIVFRGSGLEKLFAKGDYTPLSPENCIEIVKRMYLVFYRNRIPVHRMGLQSSVDFETGDEIIAGPYHPAFGHLVFSALFLDMARLAFSAAEKPLKTAEFFVNPTDISKMRGLKNSNIDVLIKDFDCDHIRIRPDNSLPVNSLKLNNSLISFESLAT